MKQLRNPGSLVGIALIWGILWATLTMIVGTTIGAVDPSQIDAGEAPIALAPVIGLVGFICGIAFAVILSAASRADRIFDVPLTRVGLLGMVVGAAVPVVTGKVMPEVFVIAPLGALSALVSVAIMRRWAALRSAA